MTFQRRNLNPDELLAVISALAEAMDLSECDITNEDIEKFCNETGWGQDQVGSNNNS